MSEWGTMYVHYVVDTVVTDMELKTYMDFGSDSVHRKI